MYVPFAIQGLNSHHGLISASLSRYTCDFRSSFLLRNRVTLHLLWLSFFFSPWIFDLADLKNWITIHQQPLSMSRVVKLVSVFRKVGVTVTVRHIYMLWETTCCHRLGWRLHLFNSNSSQAFSAFSGLWKLSKLAVALIDSGSMEGWWTKRYIM